MGVFARWGAAAIVGQAGARAVTIGPGAIGVRFPAMTAAMPSTDRFSSPSALWFLALDSGVAVVTAMSVSQGAYDKVAAALPVPSRKVVQTLLLGTAAVHVAEAVGAYRFARRRGMERSAGRWALQTFVVGFPSLLELRRVAGA